jgi:acetylornithine deacetylase/succinyl-diaminopimelate desuccinylase-like protein
VNKPLIRFARRLSSWESETGDDDLLQTEFWDRNRGQPDLRPSVYEIEPTDVVRAFAEHATAFNPPASSGGVDLGDTGRSVNVTPGQTGFSFTMKAHRELVLADRDDLLALVRHVRGSLDARTHRVSRAQVREYARTRLLVEDEEWERAKAEADPQNWLAKIAI